MSQHDCCDCDIEECPVCALYPVCVGCKTNDDGGMYDGFDIQSLNLLIIDCDGVEQLHGWVCGGCAFHENPNYLCGECGSTNLTTTAPLQRDELRGNLDRK